MFAHLLAVTSEHVAAKGQEIAASQVLPLSCRGPVVPSPHFPGLLAVDRRFLLQILVL